MAEDSVTQDQGITRREFLNYIWGASITLFLVQFGVGVYLFSIPRFREGEFGSDFDLGALDEILPDPDTGPNEFLDAKTWLVNVGPTEAAKGQGLQGIMAIYKVCTHLGCLYKWETSTDRFECPCHGSKFHLDGTKILQEGPAPRGLDRFIFEVRDASGNSVATSPDDGTPLPLDQLPSNTSGLRLIVRTSQRIMGGAPKADPT